MGKNSKAKKNAVPSEDGLLLPSHTSSTYSTTTNEVVPVPIVDTHTHLLSTFSTYKAKYPSGRHATDVWSFARGMLQGRGVHALVDVWCEAPVMPAWRELADSAGDAAKWGDTEYWFVMGVHPHGASAYDDKVEVDILEAMTHPRCVGWGEMGLDYHYDNSPREIQRDVFVRQLRHAVRLGKSLTIHTREAEEDTERILKEIVPKDHKIHIHCFTDSPEYAQRLLDHFPNLYIGITGVITYKTNPNTSVVVQNMVRSPSSTLRILLETDAPYMVPSNIYGALPEMKGKFPLSHSAMMPWTAEFVAGLANAAKAEGGGEEWDVERVMRVARENARAVYGV